MLRKLRRTDRGLAPAAPSGDIAAPGPARAAHANEKADPDGTTIGIGFDH
ncbi:hypothetical protein [Methylorubrum populi]